MSKSATPLLQIVDRGGSAYTSIDFKKDGTYIFSNVVVGFIGDYAYGSYTLQADRIVLDKDKIDHIPNMKYWELYKKEGSNTYGIRQIDSAGRQIAYRDNFELLIDNRK